jgi:hypothetical protein
MTRLRSFRAGNPRNPDVRSSERARASGHARGQRSARSANPPWRTGPCCGIVPHPVGPSRQRGGAKRKLSEDQEYRFGQRIAARIKGTRPQIAHELRARLGSRGAARIEYAMQIARPAPSVRAVPGRGIEIDRAASAEPPTDRTRAVSVPGAERSAARIEHAMRIVRLAPSIIVGGGARTRAARPRVGMRIARHQASRAAPEPARQSGHRVDTLGDAMQRNRDAARCQAKPAYRASPHACMLSCAVTWRQRLVNDCWEIASRFV